MSNVDLTIKPMFDINNPGSRTEKVLDVAKDMGVGYFHVNAVPGADPALVEAATLEMFDRMKHGAFVPVYPKPTLWELIAAHWRVFKYNQKKRYGKFKQWMHKNCNHD